VKSRKGDVDVWTFTANAGDPLALHLVETSETDDYRPWIRLWSPTGASLGDISGLTVADITVASAPVTGTYLVLVASFDSGFDGTGTYGLTVTNAPINRPPVANAGADQSVNAGAIVQLNGAASSDPDGNSLSYAWTFVSRPAGSGAAFSDAAVAAPSFLADAPGTFVIQLIVNDGTDNSQPDIVEIHTNGPPLANAGPDRIVPRNSLVQMDGSASTDPEAAPLTYHWILNNKPVGSAAALSNADIVNPTFTADRPGAYLLQLVVNDGLVNSASDLVQITTENQAPIANAGADQTDIALTALVTLDGSQSSDPDGDGLAYAWTFVARPAGSAAVLGNANTSTPSFTVDSPGRYRIQLTVTDPLASTVDIVDVTTVNVPPVANAGSDQRVPENSLVALNGGGSSDADGNPLTYAWSFVSVPTGSTAQLTNAGTIAPTFTPDRPGIYTVGLVVNDSIADSQPDTVAITVFTNIIVMALVDTELVGVGRPATLRIILPSAAPPGGVTVTVTSDDPTVLTVTSPGIVNTPEGQTTGDVTINGIASGATFVRATAPGFPDGELGVTVTPNVLTVPATLNVPFGQTSSIPITIPHPAPAEGLLVALLSSEASLVQVVTPTVLIPAGAVGVNGTLRGVSVGTANVVASAPGYSSATSIASTSGNVNILGAPFTLNPQLPRTVTLRLESGGIPVAAPAPGVVVTFAATDSTCLAVPSDATIATGLVSTSIVLAYGGTATLPCTTSLTATAAGLPPHVVNVTVNPISDITFFGPGGIRVGGGLMTNLSADGWGLTWQLGDANHGGGTMRIRSLDPARLTVVTDGAAPGQEFIDVPVSPGQTAVPFGLKAVEGQTGTVNLTATMSGFNSATVQAEVVQPALSIVSLPGTTTAQSPESVFQVAVGIPDATGTFLRQPQPVLRNLTVAVSNSTATVAQLHTATQTAQTGTVTIPANAAYSLATVATGGIAFDPLSQGQTTVGAIATNYASALGTSTDVTVTGADITFFGPGGVRVGGGLITNLSADGWTLYFVLGASGHGGGTMRIRSSNAGRLTVAADLTSAGQEFVDIPVASGNQLVPFVVRGIEGQTGPVDLTATMTGFTSATTQAEVVAPALGFVGMPGTTTTQSDETPFQIGVGIRDATNTFLRQAQPVQRDLTVSVTNLTASVAQLHTTTQTAQTATVTIPANSAYSPATVANGGIALDPLGAGQTTVTAAATNFPTALGASADMTVTGADITFFGPGGVRVGSGLMTNLSADGWTLYFILGATGHGGGTMRIRSSDAGRLTVAADLTSAGQEFVDIPVASGSQLVPFAVRGVAGQTGSVQLTATMSGFTSASTTADVVQPVLGIVNLPTTTTVLSVDTPFYLGAGIPDPTGTFVRQYQPVQADLAITVSNLTSTVAQLETSTGTGQSRTVTILAGSPFSPADLASGGIEFDPIGGGQTTVSAAAAGFVAGFAASSVNVAVTGAGIGLQGFPARVGGGLQTNVNQNGLPLAAVLNATDHGGTTIHLESSNANVLLLSADGLGAGSPSIDLPVAAGQSTAYFFIEGVTGATGTVTVTASAPGFGDGSGTVEVVPPRLMILSLAPTTTSLSPEAVFLVGLGVQPTFGGFPVLQSARADTLVSVTSSDPAVAQLHTQAGVGQNRTITIAANEYVSRPDVATGGIAFDPIGPGGTAVTASSPGFDNSVFGTVNVTVTAPRITLSGLPFKVGAGLQSNFNPFCCGIAAVLEGSDHGGVTVRIRSLTPAVALVALDDATPGAEFVDVFVPAGSTVAPYYIQGVSVGTASVSATATGFLTGMGSVDVVQPALQIESLPTTMNATDPSVAFTVAIGVAADGGSALAQYQSTRPGMPVSVTVTNSNGGVAQLVTLAGGAQSRTVVIPAGQARTAFTVADGGVELDALAAGNTAVSASIPGFLTTTAGTVAIDVTGELSPVANAGVDQNVNVGAIAQLNGSASRMVIINP
jgi:hypothetical protein